MTREFLWEKNIDYFLHHLRILPQDYESYDSQRLVVLGTREVC